MSRVNALKMILWAIVGVAASVGITRFIFGLGAATNLTDATPWGLWIGFDVMGGVALAAGGFTITAIVYIMGREEFRPIVKPAVLTAFLGYVAVIIGLLFDLGLPWNIWHMIIFWNPHSPLFEVGWCVMLYTTVLLLEFSPVPLEAASRYAKIRNLLMRFRFVFVLVGIMLSTLHQSSLGSLFLIMPYKLHPLWYSDILPILFFISAVALGLGMVCFESLISSYLYKRKPESPLIAKLFKGAFWVLTLYLIVRLIDIIISGELGLIFSGVWEGNLFIAEMLIAIIIPMIIFAVPKARETVTWQWIGSFLVVFGFVFNRINTGGLTMLRATGDSYIPSWMEFSISAGVVAGAMLVFLFVLEKFNVWEKPPYNPEADPYSLPVFDRSSETWLGVPLVSARIKYSIVFVVAMALGLAFIPGKKIHSEGVKEVKAQKARGGEVLLINGNCDDFGVAFKHQDHIKRMSGQDSCSKCHHLNVPMDDQSGCYECHYQMYKLSDVFRHEWHNSPDGGNVKCGKCHSEGEERKKETAVKCDKCHKNSTSISDSTVARSYMIPSYTQAMHGKCIKCHEEESVKSAKHENLGRCFSCHEIMTSDESLVVNVETMRNVNYGNVILPKMKQKKEE